MGILKDIMDTIKDIDAMGTVEEYISKKRYSSISQRAQEGTLQFPVLVSRSMDIKTAQMISKSLERKYASFIMISTTLSPVMTINGDKGDITDYIRQFHQNTNGKYGGQGFINDVITLARENSSYYPGENMSVLGTVCEGSTGNVSKSNKSQLTCPLDSFRTDVLNEKFMPDRPNYAFKDATLREHYNALLEAQAPKPNRSSNGTYNKFDKVNTVNINNMTAKKFADVNVNPLINVNTSRGNGGSSFVSDRIMRDNDIKKANELVPTTLHLKVKFVSPAGEDAGGTDFLVGIKATLHGVESDDMITNVVAACRNKNKLFNFIKWTTGEISFVKDLMLNIGNIKEDVVRRSAGSSPWWLALKRRRKLANIKNKTFLPTGMLPNATLVVTLEEVNFIKQQYGFDLLNPIFVDKIMEEYFLLGFVVVDSSSEIAHFMFDGQREFEILTFDGLERDNANNKGIDAKDVVKMMNRI